jgi:hypothetical protein
LLFVLCSSWSLLKSAGIVKCANLFLLIFNSLGSKENT